MPAKLVATLGALHRLILCVVLLLLISPRTASGKTSGFRPSSTGQPSGYSRTKDSELPGAPQLMDDPAAKACMVTDAAGIDDHGFNAGTWKGIQDAIALLNIEGKYLESESQTDYATHINALISESCDLIITVSFLMGDATAQAASDHPAQKFSIVDVASDPIHPNILSQVYASDEAAFLAGYAAAGVSKTGKVATFGGMQIPTVTRFMDGFALGVNYYNQQHGTAVQVLGWDPFEQSGLFTGNFEDTDDGQAIGVALMDLGADIIMPVAGPVGLGTAAAVKVHGNAAVIGVDTDWYYTAPDYKEIILTSVMKNTDKTTFLAIKSVVEGTFAGGVITGTLENGGVGLAPFHDFAEELPPGLEDELETVKAGIIDGTIDTLPPGDHLYLPIVEKISYHPEIKACLATDTNGIDDQSWNAGAWKGIQDAAALWHIGGEYLESEQQSDYPIHINTFIDESCEIIITIGWTMGDATSTAAAAHPAQKFTIIDFANNPVQPNILSQVYASDEAAFLAGYAAAGLTKTGKVGTFGGMQIPTVTAFMDGFALGVNYYNQRHYRGVQVLGWDPALQTGLFIGNFTSFTDGYVMGATLMAEGADIIMVVAGPAGLGTAAAIKEHGNAYFIGVDTDWYYTAPVYQEIILTSVMKNTDATTFFAIQSVLEGSFAGGNLTGTLENGGVGLAPFHDLAGEVPAMLLYELSMVKAGIIDGTIATSPD